MNPNQWRVVAATVRGRRHEKTGQPCQDFHQWKLLPDQVLTVAVADGAGTAGLAEVGAELAVRKAVEQLGLKGSDPILKADEAALRQLMLEGLIAARQAIYAEAGARKAGVREFATTLILVIATPSRVAAAQIGDGAVAIAAADGQLSALTRPSPSEYLNETVFLTSPDALEKAQIEIRNERPVRLAVLSDGLQMLALKMPGGTPHAPFFSPLLRLVEKEAPPTGGDEQLAAFLRSPRVGERTDDDLTLLLAAQS
jgi:hypothetical protein